MTILYSNLKSYFLKKENIPKYLHYFELAIKISHLLNLGEENTYFFESCILNCLLIYK